MMPTLETRRLVIRPFVMEDLAEVYQLLDIDLNTDRVEDEVGAKAARAEWLRWTIAGYTQLAKLYQPPYGDRAIILKSTGTLIGVCGYVPCLNAFEQMPNIANSIPARQAYNTPEVGLYYAIAPSHQRQEYAFEAAQALVKYAFEELQLKRIVATTEYDNAGSQGVMRKLGMNIARNPLNDPPWLQIVGVLEQNQ